MKSFKNVRNPILPLNIHIPDSEAHVMSDGKLYIYGSYDDYSNLYCSERYHVISTADMENWNIYNNSFHGSMVPWFNNPDAPKYVSNDWGEPTEFVKKMQETTDEDDINFVLTQDLSILPPLLFAPDCIEKDGKYYLYFCMADGSEGVAVSDRPEGPFMNPIQLPCSGIDPAVFVDENGDAYYYWGQFRSHAVKLNSDMVSFDQEKVVDRFLTEEEHFFHEGSSIRRIGDTYYAVFADVERGKPTALGYATSKSPLGPFTYRGILIDNTDCDPSSWNNHGSIECFDGKWYIFYHRSSRNTKIYRRLCIEPITIREDGTIEEVKMTSQGLGEPFKPGEKLMGYQACGLKGSVYIDAVNEKDERPEEALVNIASGDEVIFRYVKSERDFQSLIIKAEGSGCIEIWMNDRKAGKVEIQNGQQLRNEIFMEAGEYELMLRFLSAEKLEVDWIQLA